ncbi:MAG: sensor histidine kinase [Clostridia bacterium]|nr:sensor histidine kinase [Clostridia bacterium]
MLNFGEMLGAETAIAEEDIALLEDIRKSMRYSADLASSDVFLDCYDKSETKAIVVAHEKPRWSKSLYQGEVVGQFALRDNEPAVYHALETGVPVHDLKAVTQEGKTVKQDVVPVQNAQGKTIAVLIREKDVSETLVREKKYRFLAKQREKGANADFSATGESAQTVLREAHHRIKNNLQLIVSMMRMQSRASDSEEVKKAFSLNMQRVLTIASIHDILTNTDISETAELKTLIKKVVREIGALFEGSRKVKIAVSGDSLEVAADAATATAVVVNELVTNALLHGYGQGAEGRIRIGIKKGNRFVTISVEDDGCGFNTEDAAKGNGLPIVTRMVKDKLHGVFRIKSDKAGTKAAFDFEIK